MLSGNQESSEHDGVSGHQPKPAIMFLVLPLLLIVEVFRLLLDSLRLIAFCFAWFGRLLLWLMRPRILWCLAFLLPWIVVFHVVWFAHGWSAFRPLCWGEEGYPPQELMGPMTSEATDAFHDFFVSWLGPDSVRRSGPNQIDVRPSLRMIPTSYLWNVSRQVAQKIAARRGVPGSPERDTETCGFIEEMLMESREARRRSEGWGYWPYNTIDEYSPVGRYLVFYHCSDRPPRC